MQLSGPTVKLLGALDPPTRGGRSHFFRLRSCSKISESRSGSGNFSNLWIRLLFRHRLPSIQPKCFFLRTHVFYPCFHLRIDIYKRPRKFLLLPKFKSDSGSGSGSERKTQNPAGFDSGSMATSASHFLLSYTVCSTLLPCPQKVHNTTIKHISIDKAWTNSTGWAKDGQSSHLINPSLYLKIVKFQ